MNKLAKARKTRTSPGTLGLKKFGLGKLWVKKVFGKYTFKKYTFKKNTFRKYTFGKYTFGKYTFGKYTFGKHTFEKYTFGKYTLEIRKCDQPTDRHTWVGARDTCVSKNTQIKGWYGQWSPCPDECQRGELCPASNDPFAQSLQASHRTLQP